MIGATETFGRDKEAKTDGGEYVMKPSQLSFR